MRAIKLVLLSAVILFLIATAIASLIPSHIRISRAINLNSTPGAVLGLISDTSTWSRWHPLIMARDSAGENISPFNISSLHRTDSSFETLIQQGAKAPVGSSWQVYRYASTDSITLQWYMDFNLKWYPWQKFSSMFFEGSYGSMMEQGLDNIRKSLPR